MFAATFGSTMFKIMLLLHVLGAIVAFGAAFVNPIVHRIGQQAGAGAVVARGQVAATIRISLPAMIITGLLGFGVAGTSKPAGSDEPLYSMSQSWLMVAVLVWLILVAIYFFGVLPALRKVGEGDESASKIAGMLGGVSHLLLVVMLFLMIWKPGF